MTNERADTEAPRADTSGFAGFLDDDARALLALYRADVDAPPERVAQARRGPPPWRQAPRVGGPASVQQRRAWLWTAGVLGLAAACAALWAWTYPLGDVAQQRADADQQAPFTRELGDAVRSPTRAAPREPRGSLPGSLPGSSPGSLRGSSFGSSLGSSLGSQRGSEADTTQGAEVESTVGREVAPEVTLDGAAVVVSRASESAGRGRGSAARPTSPMTSPMTSPTDATDAASPEGAELTVGTLAAELALIRAAERALTAGRHDDALQALERHAARFPDGQLSQEREASRITALCRSDPARVAEGERRTAQFLARWPSSHLAGRVRRACALGR